MSKNQQLDLFENDRSSLNTAALARVPGLLYVADLVSAIQQEELLREIDAQPWMTDLKRRVQHYGYRYSYRARSVDRSMRLGDLPAWAVGVAELMQQRELIARSPDQVIVNEYEPGQGIYNHIDCVPCFDGNVASLSLGSACVMNFTNRASGEVVPLLVEPGSALVMTGPARWEWQHGIAGRKSDTFAGRTFQRCRRVSLTFRKVILQDEPPTS